MFIDLTHTFNASMPVYPGDPTSELKQVANISEHGFNDDEIKTAMHVGTHIDAPLHMIEGGKKISEIPVDRFMGRGVLVDVRDSVLHGRAKLKTGVLEGISLLAGDVVLFYSGFDKYFGSKKYFEDYPEFSEELALKLVEVKIKIVGMDTPSPDRSPFKVHKILLGNDILIVENLTNLKSLVGQKFQAVVLPPKLETNAAPVRAVASIL